MKEVVFVFFFLVLSVLCTAQKVSNIRAEQRGQEIVVLYSLESSYLSEIKLLCSQDNGVNWSAPLKNVSGDIGKYIASGENTITWNVLEEREQFVGEKIKFKIIASNANSKKALQHKMILVEGGMFQMGSNSGELDEVPVHSVTLSSFKIGKYEVTQAQWLAVMGSIPGYYEECSQCPVDEVPWPEVQEFIRKLNTITGRDYRLPTEAEWEYAAKGGKLSRGYVYSGSNNVNSVAWYVENSGDKIHPVGMKQANELGIHDMSGNAWEWCSDWHDHFNNYSEINPTGAYSGQYRVLRGGRWAYGSKFCRVTDRDMHPQGARYHYQGFRLVLPAE
jgi:formylglycine-generating enzyme required for sulfatase activity